MIITTAKFDARYFGIDVNKASSSKERDICQYWFF